jgi:hypothetical protein
MARVGGGRDRAISITFGYVLALAITTVLIAGLLTAGSAFLTQQREDVVRAEFQEVGQQLAHDIAAADRINRSLASNQSVRVQSRLPQRIGGRPYQIVISRNDSRTYRLTMTTDRPRVNTTVTVRARSDIAPSAVAGGPVVIRSVNDTTLEVTNVNATA